MKVLLTGANSFSGRVIAADLVSQGHEVYGTYRTSDDRLNDLASLNNLHLLQVALEDQTAFEALPAKLDAIIHCAAAASQIGLSQDDYIRGNVVSTYNLARHANTVGVRKFILLSSLSVHGDIEGPEVSEATPVLNPDLYGASKYLGERLLADLADELPSVAIRLPAILGKGAHRSWLPGVVDKIKNGRTISVYNPGGRFNNAVLVTGLSRFCLELLDQPIVGHSAFPIGAQGFVSIREVLQILSDGLGKPAKTEEAPAPQSSFTISSRQAIESFGYAPDPIAEILSSYAKAEALR